MTTKFVASALFVKELKVGDKVFGIKNINSER